jgi:hypothetical protein
MTLDDIFHGEAGKEALDKSMGKPFGIDLNKGYKKDKDLKYPYDQYFYKQAKDLFDLLENYQRFQKDDNDSDARDDLTEICEKYLKGTPAEDTLKDPNQLMNYANDIASQGMVSMAKWVEKNIDDVFDEFSTEQLYQIFSSVPLYNKKQDNKSGTDDETKIKEHNRIKKLRDKVTEINRDLQENKGEGLRKILEEDIKEYMEGIKEKNPQLLRYIRLEGLTNMLVKSINNSLIMNFADKEGKELDRDKIIDYLKDNYKVVEDYTKDYEKDKDYEKIKAKAWDKNLKGQYFTIAQALYNSEKTNYKKQELKDNDYKREAKEAGIKI